MLFSILVTSVIPTVMAQVPPTLHPAFSPREIRLPDDSVYKYAIFLPASYEHGSDKKWPLILFLHGSGEVGADGVAQTTVGLPPYIARHRRSFEFITIMPQAHTKWFRDKDEGAVWLMLEKEIRSLNVDRDRVYITGLSMGGFATWEFICKRPDVFAAAAPVCGLGNPLVVANAKNMPIWAFHGARDMAVPVSGSREPIEALRLIGANPIYTEYADADHFVWDRAYGTERLYSWFLSKKREPPPASIEYIMMQPNTQVWWLTLVAPAQQLQQLPRASASIAKDGKLTLNTTGVMAWAIASNDTPLKPGDEIEMTWNGQTAFKGKFPGVITYAPKPTNSASETKSEEKNEPGR